MDQPSLKLWWLSTSLSLSKLDLSLKGTTMPVNVLYRTSVRANPVAVTAIPHLLTAPWT